MEPELPTYPTLLMYTQEWALELFHESVAEPAYDLGFGERETEQEAGAYAYAIWEQYTV